MARYETYLTNEYTGEQFLLTANDKFNLEGKIERKLQQWEREEDRRQREEEKKRRQREVSDGIAEAEQLTTAALEEMENYKTILQHTLSIDDRINWDSLKDHTLFREFIPDKPPSENDFGRDVPGKSIWEFILPFLKTKRIRLEKEAQQRFDHAQAEYQDHLNFAQQKYNSAKKKFEESQKTYNQGIDELRSQFEANDSEAIEKYAETVLERSQYPESLNLSSDVFFIKDKRTILVAMDLPPPGEMPKIVEHKFVAARNEFATKELKKSEQKDLYEEVISQVAIRTIHEMFESIYNESIDFVVFNGWVDGVDAKTGNPTRNCIVSIQAEKEDFESLNLARVSPRECITGLKGLVASEFVNLAPVQPVLHLNRKDRRIIEAEEILSEFDQSSNLATMDWAKFEQLIRDLFEKEFSGDGVEVKVTQASRDAGVDAIVFDPDPIKGGKFVIQAKRYNNIVGVSAVRDLYGTVMNEGAVKGILVTTSNYGKDSREFAKNKPITLINGSELIYMFNKHGYDMNIKLTK